MAQRQCESPRTCPVWARAFLAGIISVSIFVTASTESAAQYGRITDGARGPSVFVDMDVLRALGPAQSVPRVLQPTFREPRMPRARRSVPRFPGVGAPARTAGRIVLTPPSGLKARTTKRRASSRSSKRRAPLLTPPKTMAKSRPAQRSTPAPRLMRPGTRPPAAPVIQTVRQIPAVPKPPRALVKPVRKTAPPRPMPKVAKRGAPETAPKIRKPPMPSVLARPTPPPPRPSIKPPPMPRKTVAKITPPVPRSVTPPPVRKVTPPPAPRQTASLPSRPSGSSSTGQSANLVRLGFKAGEAKLPAPAVKQLDIVIGKLTKQTTLRLQLLAYADGATTSASQARRLSLSRALAVRSYLIDKGIRSTRIDVRALGNQVKGSPADRVDVIINSR